MEQKAIFAEALTKSYGKARGISGLNLTVDHGAFFGFIGPNGAGKSTTIRTLLGLISPTSGKASVLGLDIANKKAILERVGYLPSDIHGSERLYRLSETPVWQELEHTCSVFQLQKVSFGSFETIHNAVY